MAALDPVPNVGSQIERALIAYFITCFPANTVSKYNFYFSNDWKKRVAPLVDVLAHKSTETVVHSRDESYMVRIEAKWKGNNVVGEANPDTNWVAINNFIGVIMAAMSQSDNGGQTYDAACALITAAGRALAGAGSVTDQANNADMATFTCQYIEFKGSQRAEMADGAIVIKEVRNFEVRACAINVD